MKSRPPWDTVATALCFLHTELYPWSAAGVLRSALPVRTIGSGQKRCFSWDLFSWLRDKDEKAVKNQTHYGGRSSCLMEICISLALLCHWPKNVRRLHSVSAQQTSVRLIQEGTASYAAMTGDVFFFPLLGGEVKTRTAVQFSVEMKEKSGEGSTREANY